MAGSSRYCQLQRRTWTTEYRCRTFHPWQSREVSVQLGCALECEVGLGHRRDWVRSRDEITTFWNDRLDRTTRIEKYLSSLPNGDFPFSDYRDCPDDETPENWSEDCIQKGDWITSNYSSESRLFQSVAGVPRWDFIKQGNKRRVKRARDLPVQNLWVNKNEHSLVCNGRTFSRSFLTLSFRLARGIRGVLLRLSIALSY